MKLPVKVCIVEDQEDVREALTDLVKNSEELLLLSAHASAEEALEAIPVAKPDVVIMDINLPGINGIQAIHKLKPLFPEGLYMMFTVFENSENVFNALEAGANGYLLKNTPPAKIKEAILELYAGGSPMNAHIARKLVARFRQSQDADYSSTYGLSTRETEILELLSKGLLYKEIALKLTISTGTVKQHIHKIYHKLHVQNRTEALNKVYNSKSI